VLYPWGNEDSTDKMNIWQGKFPDENLRLDGYENIAPAKSFFKNSNGVYNMLGNVWEWVSNDFDVLFFILFYFLTK